MRIDYLGHSGFFAETDAALLLFDYFRGGLDTVRKAAPGKPLFVFVSHAHKDHFNPEIFSLRRDRNRTAYLLSFDLRENAQVDPGADVTYLDADRDYTIPGLGTVRTLRSTDEGVAFLVNTGERTLFHAGDLHWWDWDGEDPDWLQEQETVFKGEIAKLAGERIDAAFVVLDDRLEGNYDRGMAHFLTVCRPKAVLPMHFWQDRSVIRRYLAAHGSECPGTEILDTAHENHWEL